MINFADIIVVGVILLFTALGYKNGFFLTLMNFIKNIVALVVAFVAMKIIAPIVATNLIKPFLTENIQQIIEEYIGDNINASGLTEALGQLDGIFGKIVESLDVSFVNESTIDNATYELADSIAQMFADNIANVAVFIIVLIIAKIVLEIIIKSLNFILKAPFLSPVNKMLGAVLGFTSSAFIVCSIIWIVFSVAPEMLAATETFSDESMETSFVVKYIVEQTPDLFLNLDN